MKWRRNRGRQSSTSLFDERGAGRLLARANAALHSRLRWRWWRGVALAFILLLVLAAAAGTGFYFLERWLLEQNDLFLVRQINFESSGAQVDRQRALDQARLWDCHNLFAVDLAEIRRRLEELPWVKEAVVARRLPDTLEIMVRERVAVARLEVSPEYLGLDASARVLERLPGVPGLPVIGSHRLVGVLPGDNLSGTAVMNALQVLDACEAAPVRDHIRILRVDLRGAEALELTLATGGPVALAWQGMDRGGAAARENLEAKLAKLATICSNTALRGQRLPRLDMTVDKNFPASE